MTSKAYRENYAQVEFKIDGYTVRGFQWWSYRTMPPTLEGMTERRARELIAELKPPGEDAARQAADAKRMQGAAE